jgi:DNA-binding transcriptional LysR family regulator
MESRPLRYFVAVAEELNFARAADRLGIAAPPLSRAVRKLEQSLGVTLFERSTRQVALTEAGAELLAQARFALDALDAAGRRARRAPKLVLAVKADTDGGLLTPLLDRYARTPGARPVEVLLCGWGDQPALLRRGEADVALIYEPYDHAGLDAEILLVEPRVAALPAASPLASEPSLTVADVHQEDRPKARDLAGMINLVELGELRVLLPASVMQRYPRDGVAYRPVTDAPPATLTIAWPQQSTSQAVATIVRTAAELSR